MQHGCKVYMDSYMAWHRVGHVSWSLGLFFKNHFLRVGLTLNQETMALRTLTPVELFYFFFIMCEDPQE